MSFSFNARGANGPLDLALVSLERGEVDAAVVRIRDCFARYHSLRSEVQKVDFSSDFLEFGDTLDSLLHAGLVAHAQGNWQTALAFFSFFEQRNERGYEAMRPLQDKVDVAKIAIQTNVGVAAYESAITESRQLTLDELSLRL